MMDLSPIQSPDQTWKKPADIMRMRQMKSKKRILDKRMEDCGRSNVPQTSNSIPGSNSDEARTNPFRRSPWKRPRKNNHRSSSPLTMEPADSSTLFQMLQTSIKKPSTSQEPKIQSPLQEDRQIPSANDESPGWNFRLPFDWSLKTALRLTSTQMFPWNSNRLTTAEEASGITGFVRCLPLGINSTDHYALDTSPNAQLFQCCQVWMHPAIPWMKLFPRHQTANTVQLHPQMIESFHADWTESFRSLFHLLRARQCPYFYVCAQSFTVLFRAPGIGANPRIHALVTPTTWGFRNALVEDGVQFTLPLFKTQTSDVPDDLDDTDNSFGDLTGEPDQQEDVVDWLKSVGVEDKMLTQLDRDPTILNREKEIDYRPQSLVYVEDGNVHALFNFLLNSKSCIASSGPFLGVPPTLLGPVAFTGATLRPLKMRQHQAQTKESTLHVFDMTGPILPHTIHYLDELLQTRNRSATKEDTFRHEIHLSTLEQTAPFSDYTQPDDVDDPLPVFGQRSLSDCGLSAHIIEAMCSQRNGILLRHIKAASDFGYRWN